MTMAAPNQKKQILVICGTAFAVCAVALGGGYYATGLVAEVATQIEGKRQEIAAAEAKIVQIPALEKEVVILRENLGEYVTILPDDKDLEDFVRMVHQFQQQSGGEGKRLTPKTGAKGGSKLFSPIEYQFEMSATIWEMLRFINLVESYGRFVSITEFAITPSKGPGAGDEVTRNGDEIHDIRLTMQTFKYNGQSNVKEVAIADYDELKGSLRDEIQRNMRTIHIERYTHRGQQGRRDVFVDPRFRGDVGDRGALPPVEQRAILDRFTAEATKLREMLERVRKQNATLFEQYALEKGLREGIAAMEGQMEGAALKITLTPYRMLWAKNVVGVVDEVRGALQEVAEGEQKRDPWLAADAIKELVEQMRQDCEGGYLEEARQRYEAVAPQLLVPDQDARHALAVEAKSWHNKVVTAIDFRALDLDIEGVVVDRSGRSGVLLNGEIYEEGEFVSEELLVKQVDEEKVWFVFRGLTLVRTM
jgi:Tfp pilus assembly protein PilO